MNIEKLDNRYGVQIDGNIYAISCTGYLSTGKFKIGRSTDINGLTYYELKDVIDASVTDYTHMGIKLKDIEKRFRQLIVPINVLSLGTEEEPFEVEVFRYSVDYDPKEWVSMFASVSRNKKASNNPELRYKLLLTETFAGGPSRPLQLEPVVLNNKDNVLTNEEVNYCSFINGNFVLGNRRMVLENPKLKEFEMQPNIDEVKQMLESYYVLRIETTHEKWSAISHTKDVETTTIAQSSRYTKVNNILKKSVCEYANRPIGANGLLGKSFIIDYVGDNYREFLESIINDTEFTCVCDSCYMEKEDDLIKININMPKFIADQIATHKTLFSGMCELTKDKYFIPDDFQDRLEKYSGHNKFLGDVKESGDVVAELKNGFHTIDVYMNAFKELGYPKEIYQRYPHHTRYVNICMWGSDTYWEKFFVERGAIGDEDGKNHTQQCTKDIVKKMYKMYKFIKEEL